MKSFTSIIESLRGLSWPWMTAIYVSAILGVACLVNPPMSRHLQAVDKIEIKTFGNMPLLADVRGEVATLKTHLKYHSCGIYSYTTYYNGTEDVTFTYGFSGVAFVKPGALRGFTKETADKLHCNYVEYPFF